MYLDTIRPDHEEDISGVRLRTPPGASETVPATPVPQPILRELFVDVSCARLLVDLFGEENESFRILTIDLVRQLAAPNGAFLSKATAIAMAPVLSNGVTAGDAIEQLRATIPHVGLYVVARETSEVSRTMASLAAAGVDEVFAFDTRSDIKAFEETIRARLAAPAPETEMRLLWKWFRESTERSLVMHCVRNGFRLDVWSVRSKVFNNCRKTLQNRVSILGLPSPGILSRYGRVLPAQELERRGMKPTTAIASVLGFPSAGAMQRSRRRLRKALMTRGRQALVFASLLK
jgi:hypothetical protein